MSVVRMMRMQLCVIAVLLKYHQLVSSHEEAEPLRWVAAIRKHGAFRLKIRVDDSSLINLQTVWFNLLYIACPWRDA